MPIPLKIKGIDISKHKSNKFTLANLYTLSFDQESLEVYIYIKYELYLIKNLKVNILISNNIFCIENFSINLANASAHILEYRVNIEIIAKSHS